MIYEAEQRGDSMKDFLLNSMSGVVGVVMDTIGNALSSAFDVSLDLQKSFRADTLKVLPWMEWMHEYNSQVQDFTLFAEHMQSISIEGDDFYPQACILTIKYPVSNDIRYDYGSLHLLSKEYIKDDEENRIGFSHVFESLYKTQLNLTLHLKDRQGNPVYIDPKDFLYEKVKKSITSEGAFRATYTLRIPLTCNFADIAEGYVETMFDAPSPIFHTEASLKEIPKELMLHGVPICMEKADSTGFIVSYAEKDASTLENFRFLYKNGNNYLKPYSYSKSLVRSDRVQDQNTVKPQISFEEWMKEKGIDPDNLEVTLEKAQASLMKAFMSEDTEQSPDGKVYMRCESNITAEKLVLYVSSKMTDNHLIDAKLGVNGDVIRMEKHPEAAKRFLQSMDNQKLRNADVQVIKISSSETLPLVGTDVHGISAFAFGFAATIIPEVKDWESFKVIALPVLKRGYELCHQYKGDFKELRNITSTLDNTEKGQYEETLLTMGFAFYYFSNKEHLIELNELVQAVELCFRYKEIVPDDEYQLWLENWGNYSYNKVVALEKKDTNGI